MKLGVVMMHILITYHTFLGLCVGYEWEDETLEDHCEEPEVNLR